MTNQTRREWLATCLAAPLARAAQAPAGRVAIGRSKTYDAAELLPALETMFDQLGGLGRLVRGKTVAMKINLTGSPTYRLGYLPPGDTHYTNPHLIAAVAHLASRAGARRVRVLESPWSTADPVEEYVLQAGWEPLEILGAGPNVEFENTNYLGRAKKYSRLRAPSGGYLFPAFDVNHSYEDCDVFVSIAKMKEHATTGVTLAMKNCFGLTPATIYGAGAGENEPSAMPSGGRGLLHTGYRGPSKSAPQSKVPDAPKQGGWRVPRIVADLVAARPVHLSIIDGVKTMAGGEGPWASDWVMPVEPGVIVAGLNPVETDAVGMAVMGYDPMAVRGAPPFERCDNMLRLADEAGLGTRDLTRIEIAGLTVREARFDFAALRGARLGLRTAH
jgi:uncharacterized protein (DUF362 family)